jgi:3-demethoxyubiquinol 3-hydroxylase
MQKFDVIVFGAGMIGASAALGLARQNKRVALIEPNLPDEHFEVLPDMRVSAISLGSQRYLAEIGIWQALPTERLQAYTHLSVWEKPSSKTTFSADLIGEHRLGHILENRLLQVAALRQLQHLDNVAWFTEGNIVDPYSGLVEMDNGERVSAKVIIVAEGAQSITREKSGLGTSGWQYQQQVLGISVTLPENSGSHTWQRFTATGPKGFLPLFGHNASLVWYGPAAEISELAALSVNDLKAEVHQAFPELPENININASARFPITRMHATRYGKGRILLAGDAAHAINPLAGQGVNLGFKDVQCLIQLLKDERLSATPETLLDAYAKKRRPDNLLMMSAMDGFYTLFSNDNPMLKLLRNTALAIADKQTLAKQQVLKYAAGIA